MAIHKGVCKLTNKEEIIWFDLVSAKTQFNTNGVIIGLMTDCSVCKRLGIHVCEDCNIYEDLTSN